MNVEQSLDVPRILYESQEASFDECLTEETHDHHRQHGAPGVRRDRARPLVPTPESGRVQLALNVNDLTEAVIFYTKLLGVAPAKIRPGYANFSVVNPLLRR